MTGENGQISIWFFIGCLLTIYGVLITGAGLYELGSPPARTVVLAELHAPVWWGLLMLAGGLAYAYFFRPSKDSK
ncbi:MAG TPA: hypothetical protein PKJ41_08730 [Bryobacteraceae bacterium]|nr:hypothetical protein [Bryobacteraceae bacterium]HPT26059.1 hypothetical protein [Bryobacteraceae bacterium]